MFNRKPIKIKLAFKSPHWVILIRNNDFDKNWDYVRTYEKIEALDEWKEKILISPVKTFDTLAEAESYIAKFFTSRYPKVNLFIKIIQEIKNLFKSNKPQVNTENKLSTGNNIPNKVQCENT